MRGPDGESITVVLGNASPKDKAAKEAADGAVVDTVVKISPDSSLIQAFNEIAAPGRGLWDAQSDEPPDFVESNSDALALLLCEHYGCRVGRQKGKQKK